LLLLLPFKCSMTRHSTLSTRCRIISTTTASASTTGRNRGSRDGSPSTRRKLTGYPRARGVIRAGSTHGSRRRHLLVLLLMHGRTMWLVLVLLMIRELLLEVLLVLRDETVLLLLLLRLLLLLGRTTRTLALEPTTIAGTATHIHIHVHRAIPCHVSMDLLTVHLTVHLPLGRHWMEPTLRRGCLH
jgi:hypothetical protein